MGKLKIEIDRENDGRFIAEVPDLAGVIVYGATLKDAVAKAQALALRVIADRIEHGESVPDVASCSQSNTTPECVALRKGNPSSRRTGQDRVDDEESGFSPFF
jgi:predicted RNase H-like HicB family nuclease